MPHDKVYSTVMYYLSWNELRFNKKVIGFTQDNQATIVLVSTILVSILCGRLSL